MKAEVKEYLARAVAASRARLADAESEVSLAALDQRIWSLPPPRSLEAALRDPGRLHLIAEMVRAAPGGPPLTARYDPETLARSFASGGAAAVSVVTEPDHFGGSPDHLKPARGAGLPVIRRDVLVSPYQVAESRVGGADAVVLIAAALGEVGLRQMLQAATRFGVAAIVEVHEEDELEMAAACGSRILCVSARDPRTLRCAEHRCLQIAPRLPRDVLRVADGDVSRPEQIRALREARYDAVFVGDALMRADDRPAFLKALAAGV